MEQFMPQLADLVGDKLVLVDETHIVDYGRR